MKTATPQARGAAAKAISTKSDRGEHNAHAAFPQASQWTERELVRIGPLVRDLHALGPRPLLEFLRELIGPDHVLAVDAEELLKQYARLDPDVVEALGGRDLQVPLAVVEGGGR